MRRFPLYSTPLDIYKLKSPIVGVERTSTGMLTRKIPSGTILRVPAFDTDKGIIEVRIGNETIGVYIEDLKERADLVES